VVNLLSRDAAPFQVAPVFFFNSGIKPSGFTKEVA
jgi:hypothetical protein